MENQPKPLTANNRQQTLADRGAIKGDYKLWKDSLSYKDFATFAKKCYNEYTEYSLDLSLPRDVRVSYLDQASSFKKILDYIERQTS